MIARHKSKTMELLGQTAQYGFQNAEIVTDIARHDEHIAAVILVIQGQ